MAETQAYCGVCNLHFGDRLMACMHQGVHAVDNPLRCNICGYVFFRASWTSLAILHGDIREKIQR